MSGIVVLKFGGAALRDGASVDSACRIVAQRGGDRPVLVVSAHAGVTDLLENAARAAATGRVDLHDVRIRHRSILAQLGLDGELCDRHLRQLHQLLEQIAQKGQLPLRDLDLVLSFGERISARIVARALAGHGLEATPVDAFDLGFVTDSNHGHARPLAGIGADIKSAIDRVHGIPVVTGFLARDSHGHLTTLGRNGSDLTASVLAEALAAREIQFWKPVPGILTADPELVPDARCIPWLTYLEAAECAFHGSRLLHPASVAPALRAAVAVRVLDVRKPDAPGTVFVMDTEAPADQRGPVAIATKAGVVRMDLQVDAPEERGELASRLFSTLDEFGLSHGLLSVDGLRLSAVVEPGPGMPGALDRLGPIVTLAHDLAVVAVVGSDVGSDTAVGVKAYETLRAHDIDVVGAFLGDRERSQCFLVHGADLMPAARALHANMLTATRAGQPGSAD
ncbi:MAG: aspartate kinase [Chlamydiales bacterium]|jgi:aspartate kinase